MTTRSLCSSARRDDLPPSEQPLDVREDVAVRESRRHAHPGHGRDGVHQPASGNHCSAVGMTSRSSIAAGGGAFLLASGPSWATARITPRSPGLLGGEAYDAVVDVTDAPSLAAKDVEALLGALLRPHTLFVSTCRVYNHGLPTTETTERNFYWGDYARHKIGEDALRERHRREGWPDDHRAAHSRHGPAQYTQQRDLLHGTASRGCPSSSCPVTAAGCGSSATWRISARRWPPCWAIPARMAKPITSWETTWSPRWDSWSSSPRRWASP